MTAPGAFLASIENAASPEARHWLIVGFAAVFGMCVGSFLNVCIYRIPRDGLTVFRPRRSFCPTCGSLITWADNIPLWSWFWLRGRCRSCESPISSRYVMVEALTAALFALVAARICALEGGSVPACGILMALVSALVVASFIDLELQQLPDSITLGGLALALPAVLLAPELLVRMKEPLIPKALAWGSPLLEGVSSRLPAWSTGGVGLAAGAALAGVGGAAVALVVARWHFRRAFPRGGRHGLGLAVAAIVGASVGGMLASHVLRPVGLEGPRSLAFWRSISGIVAGSGLVYAIGVVGSWVFRKPAMGFGDVKLMGLLGAFTGWLGVIEGFFVACFVGSAVGVYRILRHRGHYIPFGPFLAAGCLLVVLWPGAVERAFEWYTGLFR